MIQMKWKIFEKDNKLHVLLNGDINKRLDMSHQNFANNVQKVKGEIAYYSQFSKTSVEGSDLLKVGDSA